MSILGGVAGNLAGGNIGRAVVSLVLDTTGYNSELEKTKAETVAATEEAGSATSKFGGVATAAYAIAGAAALSFAKSSIDSAVEHQNVLAALTAQVGDNTQAFEDQATALQKVSGFQDEAILGADTILARFNLTQKQIEATIPTVLDYARATGKTAPDAAQTIGKALLGNTRALKAVGISYTSTGNAAEDFANIQDLLNQKLGGQAAAYAQTYQGKLDKLAASFDDLKEAVGGPLVEDLTKVADTLNVGSQILDKFSGSTGGATDHLGPFISFLNDTFNPLTFVSTAVTKVGDAMGISADSTDGLTDAVGGLTPALGGMTQEAYDAATAASGLSKGMKDLKGAVQSAGEGILSLTTTVKDTFDISEKELQKGFSQMLASSVRFKRDMALLGNLDIGLSPRLQTQFETFMVSQGPGYVDRFVRSTAAQQDAMVAKWERSIGAINAATRGIENPTVTIHVNDAEVAHALANAQRLQDTLNRVGL